MVGRMNRKATFIVILGTLLLWGMWVYGTSERMETVKTFVREEGLDTGELFYTDSERSGRVEFLRRKARELKD